MNRRNSIDELRIERGLANGLKQKLQDAADKVDEICILRLCLCSFIASLKTSLNPLFGA